ncbi:MAG: hypothetical protein SFT92_04420 [Rickettsiales bacterium]|nr:hypothetical protein [Rickettsiales bacterium]
MSETLRVPVNDEPSWFTKETAIGFLMAGPLGFLVGGYVGKQRMEREKLDGRIVEKPSFWNKDMLLGGLLGGLVGSLGAVAVVVTAAIALHSAPILAFGGLASALGYLVGAAGGAYYGGTEGEKTMEQEYAQAVALHRAREPGRAPLLEQTVEREPAISHQQRIEQQRALAAQQQHAL